jgi:hypothetical protein
MIPKEKAKEMVRKYFDILAKASNYKGLKIEGEKKFYAIEKIAKKIALISVDEIVNSDYFFATLEENRLHTKYWYDVQREIDKL